MTDTLAQTAVDLQRPALSRLARWSLPAILLISLVARVWYAVVNPLSYDETHNLMIGMLANEGYAPYREVYSVIMPFAVVTMQASAWLWGPTPAVRLLLILYGLAGVAALFYIIRSQTRALPKPYPTVAASFAALFFSFNPHYFFVSTSINLEAGAMGLGLLALAFAERYRVWGQAIWIFLSGLFFGLCVTFKVLLPFLPAVIALQVILAVYTVDQNAKRDGASSPPPHRVNRPFVQLVMLGFVWTAGVLLVLVAWLLIFDRPGLLAQVIGSRFELRNAIESEEAVNIAESLAPMDFLQYLPLVLGSVLGLAALVRSKLTFAWIWPVWIVLAGLFLLSHDPVRPRHTVTLLPPLAALSGIGLAAFGLYLAHKKASTARWANPALATVVAGLAIVAPVGLIEIEPFRAKHPARAAVIDFVQDTTAPGDCIVSKENRLHFLAGRLSTPHLSLISTARLFSGLLPGEDIAAEAEKYDCPILVYADTFDRLTPELREAAGDVYALRLTVIDPRDPGYPMDVYAVQQATEQIPSQIVNATFAETIQFQGFDLLVERGDPRKIGGETPAVWQPGQTFYLSTYWQALDQVPGDYKFFVHLTDAEGTLVQGYDHYPFELDADYLVDQVILDEAYRQQIGDPLPDHYPATGMLPTRAWIPERTLKETVRATLPADLAPGVYTLSLGLYDENSMARLPVQGDQTDPVQNWIVLTELAVEK